MPSNKKLSLLALACGALMAANAANAAAAVDRSLGGGLRQLVREADTADARLALHMSRHLQNAAGEPLVHVTLKDKADARALLPKLAAAGLRVTAVSKLDPSRLEGFVSLRNARALASLDIVRSVSAIHRPMKSAGSVQSQAVAMQKADITQAKGYDGTGIKIGALSDSFDACTACFTRAADDVASGDLPAGGVTVLTDLAPGGGTDEGRAMLQLIHDVAPGAQLAFSSAFGGEVDFSNQMLALRNDFGADVIVDDVYYYDEPFFSDGLLAQTVDQVAAAGGAYYSSAGNNGLEAYEATYQPLAWAEALKLVAEHGIPLHLDQVPADLVPKSVHIFSGSTTKDANASITNRVTTAGDSILNLQWDEPFYKGKVATDYNVYLFDKDGNWLDPNTSPSVFYTTDDNVATDAAYELAEMVPMAGDVKGGAAQSDYLVLIGKMNDGPASHIKYVAENTLAVSQYEGAPSVSGHNSAAHGQGVGAIYYGIPNFPEDFSSPGPVTIYFDKDGNRLRSPQIRQVPQVAAADGIDNTFFGFDADLNGLPNFFGTSAAAPDAAAVAAIALQAAGGPGSLAPEDLYAVLQNSAKKVPVADQRLKTKGQAGPVLFQIHGDWTRWGNYFELALDKNASSAVSSITFDSSATAAGVIFSTNLTRFYLGDAHGVAMSDITVSETPDQKTYTLTFLPGSFAPGDHFHFGTSVYNPIQGSTQEDADRMAGMKFTVNMADGTTYTGTVAGPKKSGINRFTGHGLVDAAAAVRSILKP